MVGLGTIGALFLPYLSVVVIIVLTVVVAWVVSLLVGRLLRPSTPQLAAAGRQLGATVVGLIGGTLALQALGVNPAILLVMVGLLGAGILVALREPLGNYGAKYFSNIYTPFKVGDTIQVQGFSGKVIEINAMTTVLLSDNDQLVSVPNASMIRDVVINTSPQAWKEITLPVAISGNVDLPAFESELLKSLSKLRTRLDPRFPPVLTTKARTPQSTELILTLMIRRPEDRDAITAEVNKRLTEVLDRARGGRR
ncbi:MAG: mechanosensitive ion channel domain-containing protein [Thermoplasmata archaeon]